MNPKFRKHLCLVTALAVQIVFLLAMIGCSGRDLNSLKDAVAEADPVVFEDGFGNTLDYSAFLDSYYEALTIDATGGYDGSVALRIDIPGGNWAGGTFWTHSPRDLSGFNALTFYARSSVALNLNACGFGLDVNSTSPYKVEVSGIPLTESWRLVVIPIPNPMRLTNERGMFWFSEAEAGPAVTVWFDEVKFANVPTIINPRPAMDDQSVEAIVGELVPVGGTKTTFAVDGVELEVAHQPYYFTYFSSDESVALAGSGTITAVGGGSASITAKLDMTDVVGEVAVQVVAPPPVPATAPTLPAGDVISIFSDAYTNVAVNSWYTPWSTAGGVFDRKIAGDNVKVYKGLVAMRYAGIELAPHLIDAATAGMTHLHIDLWAPTGTLFYIKLVDFGPNGVYNPPGGDDTEKLLLFHALTTPSFAAGGWSSLEIPLSSFTNMNFGHVAQLVLQSSDVNTVYVDNLYFHK